MMLRTAGAGLTTPAVVGRGLSEGLGRSETLSCVCGMSLGYGNGHELHASASARLDGDC
jgi:hypothetical protein